jgi:uncharacterized membrane protein
MAEDEKVRRQNSYGAVLSRVESFKTLYLYSMQLLGMICLHVTANRLIEKVNDDSISQVRIYIF